MEIEASGVSDGPRQSLLRLRVRHNHRRKPSEPQRASSDQRQETGGSMKLLGKAPRPRLERGRGSASADDSQSREVGSQNQYTVEQDDAEARHLLGPLLDDLSDGGPSTNRRGYVKET